MQRWVLMTPIIGLLVNDTPLRSEMFVAVLLCAAIISTKYVMQGAHMRKRKDTWTQLQNTITRDRMQIDALDMRGKERWLRVRGWTYAEYIDTLDKEVAKIEKQNEALEAKST